MLKLMVKYAVFGGGEMFRSVYHRAQVKLLQRFVPSLKASGVTRNCWCKSSGDGFQWKLGGCIVFDGGEILFNHKLEKIGLINGENPATNGTNATLDCKYLITCAGLYSDRVAQLSGCSRDPKIIPFRGEYLKLKPHMRNLVHNLSYILLGPNAVLAFSREGYNYFNFSPRDVYDAISYPGMLKLMVKYAVFGGGEMFRSVYHRAQVKLLQRFVPTLKSSDVTRGIAGVRAQAMDSDGNLVDDFVFDGGEGAIGSRVLHVRNAPSPGATSSLAIAKMVIEKAEEKFNL